MIVYFRVSYYFEYKLRRWVLASTTARKVVNKMALVSRMVSDLSGNEIAEGQAVELVVKQHPAIDSPKSLDVNADEVKGLKDASNVVIVVVKNNGDTREVAMTHAEFKKLVSDDVVKNARGTRGRRPGWSPKSK